MLLFTDNDILLKLANCYLLDCFIEELSLEHQQIFLAQGAKFSLNNQIKKKLKSEEVKLSLSNFLENVSYIKDVLDNDLIDSLLSIPNIDSGEAVLFAKLIETEGSFLATGDKRSLQSILKEEGLQDFRSYFVNRVYTFESALLLLLDRRGFEFVSSMIAKNPDFNDSVLRMAFGQGRDEQHARACLGSYSNDLQEFLVLNK